MNPHIMKRFHQVIRERDVKVTRALEVGGYVDEKSLLRIPELESAERLCLNLVTLDSQDGITAITGTGNRMDMFEDGSLDLVVSNATLEHDPRFWLSVAEMRRVLRPGGLLIIGVPGFIKDDPPLPGKVTHTFRVHMAHDYYRFSLRAVREVFLEDMDDPQVFPMLKPPRIIGHAIKPG
jgi:SAM-dependent methyltransferase